MTWPDVVGAELANVRCVVVAWSSHSVESEWVLEEAAWGRKRKALITVRFDHVEPPFGFSRLHAPDLVSWSGATESETFTKLVKDAGYQVAIAANS